MLTLLFVYNRQDTKLHPMVSFQFFNFGQLNRFIGLVGRVFGRPEFNPWSSHIQQYKVRIEGKVKQSRERSNALASTSV